MLLKPGHSLLNAVIALLLAWLLGLALFVHDVMGFPEGNLKTVPKTDGIVVLTGGAARVEAGLDLLMQDTAPRLLISGVDPRAELEKIVPAAHPARKKLACCIVLGTTAADTWGNAREAAAWAQRDAMHRLLIVTSNYHMRRSLIEFRRALPDTELIPFPLVPEQVRLSKWWDYPGTASLLIGEYNKLLLAYARGPLHRMFGS
ncbi:MAG: YdcF family protein [Proteobacteria bacterium]|nr:YdcF family protein [Pseudomonadota bacterium]